MASSESAPKKVTATERRLRTKQRERAPLPPGKLWLFRLIAGIVLPLLLLAATELALRVGGAGYRTNFLVPQVVDGKPYLVTNPDFSLRFFPKEIARRPTLIQIDAVKSPGTVRIFALGESALMGDPAEDFGICRVLEVMLQHEFPATSFEFVNTGITAINSHVIREIAGDVARHEPDIFFTYIGNNEVLGPYGPGTVLTPVMKSGMAIRAQVALKATKLGQALEAIGQRLYSGGKRTTSWQGLALFASSKFPSQDPALAPVHAHFRENLKAIIAAANRAGAPAIVSTVAVNLSDCSPFASEHTPALPPADTTAFDAAMKANTIESLKRAVVLSPRHAEAHYLLAKAFALSGDHAAAAPHFATARDEDALRFRADSTINAITREVAAEASDATLVDLEKYCADLSNGAPGEELFYEHVHMTFRGNYVMAAQAMPAFRKYLGGKIGPPAASPMTQDEVATRLLYVESARRDVVTKVLQRINRPPFLSQSGNATMMSQLRQSLKSGAPVNAREELALSEAISKGNPGDWRAQNVYARNLYLADRREDAISAFENLIRLAPSAAAARYNYGIALSAVARDAEAVENLRLSLELGVDRDDVRYAMGLTLARQGKVADARAAFAEQEAITGKDPAALARLGEFLIDAKRPADAVAVLEDALRAAPENAGLRAALANALRAVGRTADADRLTPKAEEDLKQAMDLLTKRDYANAEVVLRRMTSRDPKNANMISELAIAVASQRRLEEALALFEQAAELQPTNALFQNNVGTTLFRLGRGAEAIARYEKALAIDPNYADAQKNLMNARKKGS